MAHKNRDGAGDKFDVLYIGTILHYDSVLSRILSTPMWRTARFRALLKWPDNMAFWDKWEEIVRNEGEPEADAFYAKHETLMLAGSEVSWSARPPCWRS